MEVKGTFPSRIVNISNIKGQKEPTRRQIELNGQTYNKSNEL